MKDIELARFVREAAALGLITGLAGSLAPRDIEPLAKLAPTYLGFRTALCRDGARASMQGQSPRCVRLSACSGAERPAKVDACKYE